MNSIRPLITITILVVAFAFLYVKINESPVRPTTDDGKAWDQTPDGVPPLDATVGTSAAADNTAPPWPATETPATTAPLTDAGSTQATASTAAPATTDALPIVAEVTETKHPAVPPMPEMPEPVSAVQPATSPTASIPTPTDLPADVPTARYPDQLTVSGDGTPVGSTTAAAAPPIPEPVSTPTPITPPATPESVNALSATASDPLSTPLATQPNPLRQQAQPVPATSLPTDITASNQTTLPTVAPVESSFVESWPTIQAALDSGQLARAHQLLSRWYDDPSLTPTDAERVESLLSQLAGTVVYSTDHQLAPAHVVKPGETLDSVAKTYNVPWQLLAKINGIPAADQVRPGQELKIVPGPFSAVVDLTRNQLTLMVDGRYAGKFPVSVSSAANVGEGQWTVDQKLMTPSNTAAQPAPASAPMAVDRAIVLREEPAQGKVPGNQRLTMASGGSAAGTDAGAPAIRLSPQDAAELSDILSIGSRVVIRR